MTLQAGQYVTDGTAVFILDDIRDGHRVGDIVFRSVLHAGFIKANGAKVTASNYPRLLKFVQDNDLLVADEDTWENNNRDKYVYNSNEGTLKLPNVIDRVLQGGDPTKSVVAGLPNISGGLGGIYSSFSNPFESGALYYSNAGEARQLVLQDGSAKSTINFNAAKSNTIYGKSTTVQPPAIALIPQIKY